MSKFLSLVGFDIFSHTVLEMFVSQQKCTKFMFIVKSKFSAPAAGLRLTLQSTPSKFSAPAAGLAIE